MDGDAAVQPYWSGGPFRVTVGHPPGVFSSAAVAKAEAVLKEFRAECQKAYFAFNGTLNGRRGASIKYKQIATRRAAHVFTGSVFPDAQQRPGRSTIAKLTQGELLDALAEGGDFEDMQNRALLVMLYHRWDEWYRHRAAKALGVAKDDIRCALMGEVRLLRNVIVHKNGIVSERFQAPLLSLIWGSIPSGYLVITDNMVYALMEQLNAIRVDAG